MKNSIIIASVVCSAVMLVLIAKGIIYKPIDNTVDETPVEATVTAEADRSDIIIPKKTQYIIKEYDNMIGVFRKGAGKPFRIIETYLFTLPYADRLMLSEGFTVSEDNLYKIVEDYTG